MVNTPTSLKRIRKPAMAVGSTFSQSRHVELLLLVLFPGSLLHFDAALKSSRLAAVLIAIASSRSLIISFSLFRAFNSLFKIKKTTYGWFFFVGGWGKQASKKTNQSRARRLYRVTVRWIKIRKETIPKAEMHPQTMKYILSSPLSDMTKVPNVNWVAKINAVESRCPIDQKIWIWIGWIRPSYHFPPLPRGVWVNTIPEF